MRDPGTRGCGTAGDAAPRRGSRVLSGGKGPDGPGAPKTGAAESYAHAPGRAGTTSEERGGEPGSERLSEAVGHARRAGTAKPTARLDTYRTPRAPGFQQPTRLRSPAGLRSSPFTRGGLRRMHQEGAGTPHPARGDWPELLFPSLFIGPRLEAVCAGAGAGARVPELFPQQPGGIPSGERAPQPPLPDLGDRWRPPRPSCQPRLDARGEEVRIPACAGDSALRPHRRLPEAPRGVQKGGTGPAGPCGPFLRQGLWFRTLLLNEGRKARWGIGLGGGTREARMRGARTGPDAGSSCARWFSALTCPAAPGDPTP